jgi:DNA-binding PadR family transcriptional regulator
VSLELAILGFLSERPRSGYDLKTRCFDDAAKPFWTADQAQIYRTLERLGDANLVAFTRRRQVGKPDRKVYEITSAGLDVLGSLLPEAPPLPTPRDTFLLQLYFSAGLADAGIERLLADRRTMHQTKLDDLRERAIELSRDHALGEREHALRQAALAGAIAAERAAIDWLDDIHESVADGLLPADLPAGPSVQKSLFGPSPA